MKRYLMMTAGLGLSALAFAGPTLANQGACDTASAGVLSASQTKDLENRRLEAVAGAPAVMRFRGITMADLLERTDQNYKRYWAAVKAALNDGSCRRGDNLTVPTTLTKDYCDFSKAIVPNGDLSYCIKS